MTQNPWFRWKTAKCLRKNLAYPLKVHRVDQKRHVPADVKKNQEVHIPVKDRVANSWEKAIATV